MDTPSSTLSPNTLAFIALCNEYCVAVQDARNIPQEEMSTFIDSLLRLLPRIYICATDLSRIATEEDNYVEEVYLDNALDEDYYDTIRRNVENLLGSQDTYLEVFHQDMKYSDTPIAASVSEGVADLFQVFYNFLETVRDAPDEIIAGAAVAVAEDFAVYWSTVLCNLLRAVNHIKYNE